jgi:hypothetical protein
MCYVASGKGMEEWKGFSQYGVTDNIGAKSAKIPGSY